MNYVVLVGLITAGVYDIYLSLSNQLTLSQRYQKQFPTWIDMMTLGIILFGLCFANLDPSLKIWIAGICGHICWPNKERYED